MVAIYGPTSPQRVGPYGQPSSAIAHRERCGSGNFLCDPCALCGKKGGGLLCRSNLSRDVVQFYRDLIGVFEKHLMQIH